MSGTLLAKMKAGREVPSDEIYVIYGAPGSGKTTLASTFPKDNKMLYIDILEGGSKVIPKKDLEQIDIIRIDKFTDLENILNELYVGVVKDDTGKDVKVKYSTIVIDTLTNLEYILKEHLKESNNKPDMTLNLWGKAKDNSDMVYNLLKKLHQKTGSTIVGITHEKKVEDEVDTSFNRIIPALMTSASIALCAKASYVWYTKVENEHTSKDDGTIETTPAFFTYIDAYPFLVTKCRKPKSFKIVPKVKDLDYDKFKKNVLDKL